MPECPGAVQTLPIGCISLARRYMHLGDPSAGPADLQKVITVGLCADQITSSRGTKSPQHQLQSSPPVALKAFIWSRVNTAKRCTRLRASRQPEGSSQNIVLRLLEEAGTG